MPSTAHADTTSKAPTGAWVRDNLTTQGYCLSDAERRELAIGLRLSTGLCLSLVVVALVLQSAEMFAWLERRRAPNHPITT